MNRTYAYLRNDRKMKFRMVSAQHFINEAPGLLPSGPKSSFQMKVNFAFHLETRSQSLEEEWRGTESMLIEVQCEVSTVSYDLGCHVICWCWSTVFSEVHSQRSHLPGNVRALHASFC